MDIGGVSHVWRGQVQLRGKYLWRDGKTMPAVGRVNEFVLPHRLESALNAGLAVRRLRSALLGFVKSGPAHTLHPAVYTAETAFFCISSMSRWVT
jgi:hypothetical protein